MTRKRGNTLTFRARKRIIHLHERGLSDAEIAEALDCSAMTVGKWLRRHKTHGLAGLHTKARLPQRVPPRRMKKEDEAIIIKLYKEHPEWTLHRIAAFATLEIYPDINRTVRGRTVRNVLVRNALLDQ